MAMASAKPEYKQEGKFTFPRERQWHSELMSPHLHNYPTGLNKGKVFLVNDTFVRVDGVDYISIRSEIGKYRWIEVGTGFTTHHLVTPKCEGYVFAPAVRWSNQGHGNGIMSRCMEEDELVEARQDHVFLRNVRHTVPQDKNPTLWVEYRHSDNEFGESYAAQKLLAFNRVLHRKRQALADKMHAEGKYDYEHIMNATFDPKKHTLKGAHFEAA